MSVAQRVQVLSSTSIKFHMSAGMLQEPSLLSASEQLNKNEICAKHDNCCGASVASEQQHKQDLRRIYKRENEFSKSSLFTRMLCGFLPECIAPSTRVHCATNNTRL